MRNLLIMTLFLALTPAAARAQEDVTQDNVMLQSAAETAPAPEPVTAEPVTIAPAEDTAVLTLSDEDILAWEESGQGKYIYFTISAEKNAELATLTAENLGKPMKIMIGDHFVIIPEVTSVLNQQNGFVLQLGDKSRTEMMYSMLDRSKKKTADTAIDLGTQQQPASPAADGAP